MKILVGMSGGVDSTVTAMLLKQQGHEVIGATMVKGVKVPDNYDEKVKTHSSCLGPDEEQNIEQARKMAEFIDIPFHVIDISKHYESIVIDNFKQEYLNGQTPNPCVWCNALIKFGIFPELAQKSGIVFDKFATGHYARIEEENNKFLLKRGKDIKKDQSYFLYRLSQEQLSKILLPLGSFSKEEIRSLAKEFGLEVADKPDSQDFYSGDYNELLGIEAREGNIVDTKGKILGKHKGIWNYTIGQRKGIGISSTEPLYVVELRKDTNEVVIAPNDKTLQDMLRATNVVWIGDYKEKCQAKIRSTQQPTNVTVIKDNEDIIVRFDDMQKSIAKGQSVVLYDNDSVIGGGIISDSSIIQG